MKRATIIRQPSTPDGTFGKFATEDGSFTCKTLELPWVDADGDGIGDPQKSCITPGTYPCQWHNSPKYGFCYTVAGVKGRSHILIHPANRAEQLLGCIAPGRSISVMPDSTGKNVRCVTESRAALNALHAWANKEPFMLEIRWA